MIDSLRLRLFAGAGIAIGLALGLAWLAMTLIFARHIERRVADELRVHAVALLSDLRVSPAGKIALEDEPRDPLFAKPASGLYWQIRTSSTQLRSRSLWDSGLPLHTNTPDGDWHQSREKGPFGQDLLVLERTVRPDRTSAPARVSVAYALSRLEPARREFGSELGVFLALLWLFLSAAAWIQVTLGLRPLDRIRAEITRLRGDPRARLTGRYPAELLPLTGEIDALADARENDVVRARRRAADLAHGLKTPLAALAAQSRHARLAGATAAADGLDQAIAAVRGAVEGELARTRIGLAQRDGTGVAARPLVERLVSVIESGEAGARVVFSIDLPDAMMLPLAGDDAAELLGPLLDNAARHARRRVAVDGNDDGNGAWLCIGDDGPGLEAARHGEAILRGARLDSAGDGHGLGLAIARELAEATGGTLSLMQSKLGGLQVRLAWTPRST